VLADHGIPAATKALLRRVDARGSLLVELDPAEQRFPTPVETTVYLALQEVVDSAARQRATSLSVRVWRQADSLAFTVEHDRPPVSPVPTASTDRVAALGGELRTEPAPTGIRVIGSIPLDPR
jgi:signal transduction histidine kinase